MGGNRVGRDIDELRKRLSSAKKSKKEYSDYLQKLKQAYSSGKISYSDYVEETHKKRNGRNLNEWIIYLDKYDDECKKEITKRRTKVVAKQFLFIFLSAILIVSFFYIPYATNMKFNPIGFLIKNVSVAEVSETEVIPEPIGNISASEELPPKGVTEPVPAEEPIQTPITLTPETEVTKPVRETPIETPEVNATIPETNITETNITEENITVPENITAPEVNVSETNETISPNVIEQNITEINITGINQTETNETIISTNITEQNITQINITIIANATIETIQYQAVLNQKVKWVKTISPETTGNLTITLPEQAENISVSKVNEKINSFSLTGAFIGARENKSFLLNFFQKILEFFKRVFGSITGKVIDEQGNEINQKDIELEIQIDEPVEYQVEYETPAPYAIETETENGKIVQIIGPETIHYENVLSFTSLPKEVSKEKIKLYRTTDGVKELTAITNYIDTDNNGLIERIEWIAPHLSNQTFEIIIEISKAEHLNSNKEFISDIYEQVKSLDDIWSETIPSSEYVRVTFEKNLTNENDITVFPKIISGTPIIEVYEQNKNEKIAEFNPIISDGYNKILLTNLQESQDTFDLKVSGGDVQFDYIVDPNMTINSQSGDVGITPLNKTAFVVVWNNISTTTGNQTLFKVMTTTGNIVVGPIMVDRTSDVAERVAVAALNYTTFAVSWVNKTAADELRALYDRSGTRVAGPTSGDVAVGATFWDTSTAALNDTAYVHCYIDVAEIDGDAYVVNINTATAEIGLNADIDSTEASANLFDCAAINSTAWVGVTYDSVDADAAFATYNSGGTAITALTTIDANMGIKGGAVAVTGLDNNKFAMVYFNNGTNATGIRNTNISATVRNANNQSVINKPGLIMMTGTNWTRIDAATVNNDSGDYLVLGFINSTNRNLKAQVFTSSLTPASEVITIDTTINVRYPLFDIIGKTATTSLCTSTFAIAYTNFTNSTIVKTYWMNGSSWNGICPGAADLIPPSINITFPINNTNWSINTVDVNYTASDANLAYCWWSNDSRQNATITCGTNITTVVWNDGIHNISVWANDTVGNMNGTYVTFIVDTIAPSINITFPINNTNTTDTLIDINFTAYNEAVTCWYSNRSGLINYTWGCNNITNVTWSQGVNNITVWANDTVGNINASYVTFTIDTTPPSINVTFPINNTNTSNTLIDINFTAYNGAATCWYTNTSGLVNYTWGCNNITNVTWAEGVHNVTVYANDTLGNVNLSRVTFVVDTTPPSINITFPINNTLFSFTGVDVNYTVYNGNVGCYYTNNSGLINTTIPSCANLTTVTWSQGINNVTIYTNDTAGNVNLSRVTFTVDSFFPQFSNYWDNNATQEGTGTAYINVTVLNTNGTVILQFDGTNYSASNSSGDSNKFNVTITALGAGTYPYNWTSYGNGTLKNFNISNHQYYTVNASADVAPEIIRIYNATIFPDPSLNLNEGPSPTGFIINFTAYDSNGDLNITTASINFSKTDEQTRANYSCQRIDASTTLANFTCNVTMWWYDSNGTWNISASILDNNTNYGTNATNTTFILTLLTGFDLSPSNLTWNQFSLGSTNQTAINDPITLNNTGNRYVTPGNIQINATNLTGETDNTKQIFANNFSVHWEGNTGTCIGSACVECGGTNMSVGNFQNITLANLTRGNFTINNNFTGQEQLFFCLRRVGGDLTPQSYSTKTSGAWTIRILLVAMIPRKKKKKTIKNEKLLDAFNLIADELKEEYSLNKKELLQVILGKLQEKYKISRKEIMEITKEEAEIPLSIFTKEIGALEVLTKYMKENLNMNYSEIARELERNERTIWTSYKKAIKKQKENIKIKEETIYVPISIFKNKKLTMLESMILYLKEKGMKYSEIGKLLNRDQRNIWTIYSRAVKK